MLTTSVSAPKTVGDNFEPLSWLESHGDYLYGFAMSRLYDENAAEDAVQETYLAAIKCNDSFTERSNERTWLTGILKHKIADHYRGLFRTVNVGSLIDDDGSCDDFFDSTGHWNQVGTGREWNYDPESVLEQREFRNALHRCLLQTPKRLACVFTLREIEGMSTAEISGLLKISPENTLVMLHRARLYLRRNLEQFH